MIQQRSGELPASEARKTFPPSRTAALAVGLLIVLALGCGQRAASPSMADDAALSDAEAQDATSTPSVDAAMKDAMRPPPSDATTGRPADGGAPTDGSSDGTAPPCEDRLPDWSSPPALLSQTGLYADMATRTLAEDMRPFAPRYQLWSDGADKARYLYLPRCAEPIDTRALDDWSFPVGTRAFKEFSFAGRPLETRFLYRFGPGRDDFMFAHYRWNEAGTEASLITDDTPDAQLEGPRGSGYRIPKPDTCTVCHGAFGGPEGGVPSRYLGLSAVQLGHRGPGLTLSVLREQGWLSHPPASDPPDIAEPETQAALGYLHANCGHCHNETLYGVHFPAEPLSFMLSAGDRKPGDTATYRTAIGVPALSTTAQCSTRIASGQTWRDGGVDGSCVTVRMAARGTIDQMPPLATHRVDEAGLELIRAFIGRL